MSYLRLCLISILCAGLAYARPGPDSNYNINIVAGGASTTTWNPSDLAVVTLSNGNLTVTAGASDGSVRSIANHSTGKYYFECKATTSAGGNTACGIANGSASLTGAPNSAALVAAVYSGGNIWVNATQPQSVGAIVNNDVIGVALDTGGQLYWTRRNTGNWNGALNGNPSAGTGGLSTSGFAGPYYAWASGAGGSSAVWVANFGATAYTNDCSATTCSGFGNW